MTKRVKPIRFHLVLFVILIVSMMVVSASASKVTFKAATIENGHTQVWWPTSNTNGFWIAKDTSVKLYIKLGSAETNVVYGLKNNSTGTNTKFASFSGSSSSSTSKTISTAARYKPYVTNNTAGTISVTSSSYIEY